jgi:hypothetical protein
MMFIGRASILALVMMLAAPCLGQTGPSEVRIQDDPAEDFIGVNSRSNSNFTPGQDEWIFYVSGDVYRDLRPTWYHLSVMVGYEGAARQYHEATLENGTVLPGKVGPPEKDCARPPCKLRELMIFDIDRNLLSSFGARGGLRATIKAKSGPDFRVFIPLDQMSDFMAAIGDTMEKVAGER